MTGQVTGTDVAHRPAHRAAVTVPAGTGTRTGTARAGSAARSPLSVLGNRALGRTLGAPATPRRPSRGPSPAELGHQPDPYVRAVLQSAVGRDLGDVRVRTGPGQRQLLDRLGVDALAHGDTVAVRPEHDHAGTVGGRALLLHELVHLLQQARDAPGTRHAGDGPEVAAELEEEARAMSVELVARPPLPARPEARADLRTLARYDARYDARSMAPGPDDLIRAAPTRTV